MKVTSFEISKKLAEIGFKDYSGQFYKTRNGDLLSNILVGHGQNDYSCDYLPTYDLETILDALPPFFSIKDKVERQFFLYKESVGYDYLDGFGTNTKDINFCFVRKANESLADTAARLLIKLHDAGLVKFKEE